MARIINGHPVVYNTTDFTLSDGDGSAISGTTKGEPKIYDAYCRSALLDKVSTRTEKYSYTNLSASGLVRTGALQVKGVYVASTSSGTLKFWDNTSAATTVAVNTFTPAVGWHEMGDMGLTTGLYVTIANTIDCTIVWKDNTIA